MLHCRNLAGDVLEKLRDIRTEHVSGSRHQARQEIVDFDTHNSWNPMMELLFHLQIGGIFVIFMERKLTRRESRFLVILLLIYYVTRRGLTIPLDALLPSTFSLGQRLVT